MAATTTRRYAPEPPIRIHEIDEALTWAAITYWPRDRAWYRWVNHLLDQRLRIQSRDPANTARR